MFKIGDKVRVFTALDVDGVYRKDWEYQIGRVGHIIRIKPKRDGPNFSIEVKGQDFCAFYHPTELQLFDPQMYIQFSKEHV